MREYFLLYQIMAEPVLVPAPGVEDITLDKWFKEASIPVLRPMVRLSLPNRRLSAGPSAKLDIDYASLAASGLIYVVEPSLFPAPETVNIDKWFQQFSLPMALFRERMLGVGRIPAFFIDPAALTLPSPTGVWTKTTDDASTWSDSAAAAGPWPKVKPDSSTWP